MTEPLKRKLNKPLHHLYERKNRTQKLLQLNKQCVNEHNTYLPMQVASSFHK